MRTPSRDATGIGLLYEYYNQLYFFERRFFSPERGLGVFFDWYVIQISPDYLIKIYRYTCRSRSATRIYFTRFRLKILNSNP